MSTSTNNTRIRILDSALILLESSQGKDVRMTDIAKRAGITRQALYLHFKTRADLLIATTYYLDELKEAEKRFAPSHTAQTGIEYLDLFIETWGNYIPEIYGIAKALLMMRDTDEAAAKAWDDRMQDVREGCERTINALSSDNMLSLDYSPSQATDILWTLLSVRNWEQLTIQCGWSQQSYIKTLQSLARTTLVQNKTDN